MADTSTAEIEPLLARMLKDERFSDITVVLTPGKQSSYKLHRAIIAVQSPYLDKACTEASTKNESTIQIPGILSATFELVVNWLYGRGYQLPTADFDRVGFIRLYKAANFLGIASLKAEMRNQLAKRLYEEIKMKGPDCTIKGPMDLLRHLAEASSHEEWVELRQILDNVIPAWGVEDPMLVHAVESDKKGYRYLAALLLDTLMSFVNRSLCKKCQTEIMVEAPKKCVRCNSHKPHKMALRDTVPTRPASLASVVTSAPLSPQRYHIPMQRRAGEGGSYQRTVSAAGKMDAGGETGAKGTLPG